MSGGSWELGRGSGLWGRRTGSSLGSPTSGSVISSMSLLYKIGTTNTDLQNLCKQRVRCPAYEWGSMGPGGCHPAPGPQRAPHVGGVVVVVVGVVFKIQTSSSNLPQPNSPAPHHSVPPSRGVPLRGWGLGLAVPCQWTLPHSASSGLSLILSLAAGCEQEWLNQDIIVFN